MSRSSTGTGGAGGSAGEPLLAPDAAGERERPRRRYELEDLGFDEVPKKYRKYYRKWDGPGDVLAPNEALCPVCKVVIRSTRELRPGDRLYCMACMTRMVVVRTADGRLETEVIY